MVRHCVPLAGDWWIWHLVPDQLHCNAVEVHAKVRPGGLQGFRAELLFWD